MPLFIQQILGTHVILGIRLAVVMKIDALYGGAGQGGWLAQGQSVVRWHCWPEFRSLGLPNQSFLYHLLQGRFRPPLSCSSPNVYTIFDSWPHLTPLADASLWLLCSVPAPDVAPTGYSHLLGCPWAQQAADCAITLCPAFCCRSCLAW